MRFYRAVKRWVCSFFEPNSKNDALTLLPGEASLFDVPLWTRFNQKRVLDATHFYRATYWKNANVCLEINDHDDGIKKVCSA